MPRYFIEVAYNGKNYAGFQIQKNANTIQAEIENALFIYLKQKINLTGSSRTDAGVHAFQNYFHFDSEKILHLNEYNINAILPDDIVIKKMLPVAESMHCRFSALSREYTYKIYQQKNPFLLHTAYFFPYQIDIDLLNEAASELLNINDFASFCKKHSQAKTTLCHLQKSTWEVDNEIITYHVIGNRFLRGMVRGMVGTMLQVATKKYTLDKFLQIIKSNTNTLTNFSVPAHGLYLKKVNFNNL